MKLKEEGGKGDVKRSTNVLANNSKLLNSAVVVVATAWAVWSGACGRTTAGTTPPNSDQPVGKRPYEMVWAGRDKDTRPPLVDFEDLTGWNVTGKEAVASFQRSREQQLWGKFVAKLTYRATGRRPLVTVRPPKPVPVPFPFDCVNLWVYGNNWAWAPDPSTPPVEIRVVLKGQNGHTVTVRLGRVRWKEWWVMHRRLSRTELKQLGKPVFFEALEIAHGRNTEDRVLYFDNLAVYKERLPVLSFQARPKRGIDLPDGQTVGTNVGPGRLPFPTREETILPTNLTGSFRTTLLVRPVEKTTGNRLQEREKTNERQARPAGTKNVEAKKTKEKVEVKGEAASKEYVFCYEGRDGRLEYVYRPQTGTLSDVTAWWKGRGKPFKPLAGGGVYFWVNQREDGSADAAAPDRFELLETRRVNNTVTARWRIWLKERSAEVTYTFRLWQKSLVVDVKCLGGEIGEFRIGKVVGVEQPRLVTVPYLTGDSQRPAVLVTGPPEQPLFVLPLLDHCRSNASLLWFRNAVEKEGVVQNGGSRYLPKTDGRRNPCFERLFLTVSPRFEEVLPNVPNPKSPWMHVAGRVVWRAHGAGNREKDYALWKTVARYGLRHILITDHETGWRDGGESFTLRTRAAPGKGGDPGQAEYARKLHQLGFRYGIYNNYTDFAPVNRHWNEDDVTRLPNGEWRRAWARCYNLKPARAVELEAELAPIIQQKFHLDTAYCDVHTAVRPWSYCDFDARVPGAGTFAATFYAYGEIMLHQKKTWGGPVYSEGNNHWYYCGLTDGNYGQDQLAHLDVNPWLVDFDLRKLHPLCCNFGMGNLGMFFGRHRGLGKTPEEQTQKLDRFLCATLAFGHTGFLVLEGGLQNAFRSYYSVQALHAAYAEATAETIRYADERGRLLETSKAVASGAFRRSQIVTQYSNGIEVWTNGHQHDNWTPPVQAAPTLPPNGWWVRDTRTGKLTAFSALVDGHRADYVDSSEYLYANGRGRLTVFPKAVCDGQLAALHNKDGTTELIPWKDCSVYGVRLKDGRSATAVALDEQKRPLGPAPVRFSRGLVFVEPVENAVSYLLKPTSTRPVLLRSQRWYVVPGEQVTVQGPSGSHQFVVSPEAVPGRLLWYKVDGGWIHFLVQPLASLQTEIEGRNLRLWLTPHLPRPTQAVVRLAGQKRLVRLVPEQRLLLTFQLPAISEESVLKLPLEITAGSLRLKRTWWLKAEYTSQKFPLPLNEQTWKTGQRLRGQPERPLDSATRATVYWTERSCGDRTKHCLFMHPPYVTGVGYTFVLLPPVSLPSHTPTAFRCLVGKADGSDPGDGIWFRVAVVEKHNGKIKETLVAETNCRQHRWKPLEADLSRWQGRTVQLKLMTDVCPQNNSSGDWGCWADVRLESLTPVFCLTLHDRPVKPTRVPGPFPPREPLTFQQLRQTAVRGVLHFQAIGLQSDSHYRSSGKWNQVKIGTLPSGGGNEAKGLWSDVTVELPKQALKTLKQWNVFEIENPYNDCFKVRNFWLELTLSNKKKISSQVTTTVFSQPSTWKYAEGVKVPQGENIRVLIRIPLSSTSELRK